MPSVMPKNGFTPPHAKPHRYKAGTISKRIENRWTPNAVVITKRMATERLVGRLYERASIEARADPELSMLLAQAAMRIQVEDSNNQLRNKD